MHALTLIKVSDSDVCRSWSVRGTRFIINWIIFFLFFYRKESRTIRLKNTKLIPVRWRLTGIGQDGIGQEFSTKTDTGIVEPLSTYELQLNYYASRPRSPASQKNKLILKLEVNYSIKNHIKNDVFHYY